MLPNPSILEYPNLGSGNISITEQQLIEPYKKKKMLGNGNKIIYVVYQNVNRTQIVHT